MQECSRGRPLGSDWTMRAQACERTRPLTGSPLEYRIGGSRPVEGQPAWRKCSLKVHSGKIPVPKLLPVPPLRCQAFLQP